MTYTWTTEPIYRGHLLLRSQPVALKAWNGATNWNNGYQQFHYLLKGSDPEIPPFTVGGEIIAPEVAFGIGKKYGQLRVIVSPLNTDGLFLTNLACHLATKWGFDEHGWYAAAHYDTAHPHLHIIAETEHAATGERLTADDEQMKQWHLHAVHRVTQVMKTYHYKQSDRAAYTAWDRS